MKTQLLLLTLFCISSAHTSAAEMKLPNIVLIVAIGNLVSTLKKEGVWENTLLFFISDNGGPLAQTADNTPLRGGKHQDYEGGVRVPFLVCWPGKLTPGESDAVVSSLDILPTTLAAAGISPPMDKPFDGINMLPILHGESAWAPRDLF